MIRAFLYDQAHLRNLYLSQSHGEYLLFSSKCLVVYLFTFQSKTYLELTFVYIRERKAQDLFLSIYLAQLDFFERTIFPSPHCHIIFGQLHVDLLADSTFSCLGLFAILLPVAIYCNNRS